MDEMAPTLALAGRQWKFLPVQALRATVGITIAILVQSRLVWSNEESNDGAVTTVTFEEIGGTTLLVLHELYPSKQALDAAGTGAADAMGETFASLVEVRPQTAEHNRDCCRFSCPVALRPTCLAERMFATKRISADVQPMRCQPIAHNDESQLTYRLDRS